MLSGSADTDRKTATVIHGSLGGSLGKGRKIDWEQAHLCALGRAMSPLRDYPFHLVSAGPLKG